MQLIIATLALAILLLTQDLKAQVRNLSVGRPLPEKGDSTRPQTTLIEDDSWRDVDVQFLSSYYEQDGNNSAVTGGLGTERLTDFTQKIIVNLPLSPKTQLNLDGGYDYYTSASSDKIDPVRSDDSGYDVRTHGNIGLSRKINSQQTVGFRLGGSTEYDYNSFQFGLDFSRESKDQNTLFHAQFQGFLDAWDLIYPIELRGQGQLAPRSDRQSFNLSFGLAKVINAKTQASVQVEAVMMNGLLSTPFHRVYFQEQATPRIERLPESRLKVPVGFRLNRYLCDFLVARAYYRFYWDNWGMVAHTASLELPIKVNRFLALTPSYRFHTQSGADFFAPYGEHSLQEAFYTSDYDLAPLSSHAVGLGISYQPAAGIFDLKLPGKKQKHFQLKSADLKYSHYLRSTAFRADIISFGLGFTVHGSPK